RSSRRRRDRGPMNIVAPRAPASFLRQVRAGEHGRLVRIVSLAVTLGVWEWYGRGVDPVFMSYPTAILEAIPAMIRSGELPNAFVSSVLGLAIGLSLSVVFG